MITVTPCKSKCFIHFIAFRSMFIFIFIFIFMFTFKFTLIGFPVQGENYVITQTFSRIKIDGVMDESVWEEAVKIGLPYEWMPGDNIPAPVETECRVTFNKSLLYIGFRCFDPEPGKIRAHLMDRDAAVTFILDDYVGIMLDTFNDERRAFQFCVNPLGVQTDAYFSELEGTENYNWDAIWKSAGKITDLGYTVEIAIPFNQLRFPKNKEKQTWGISIERSYPRNVRHRLGSHPRNRNMDCILCQENKIVGLENMSSGSNIEIGPTLTLDRTDQRESFPRGEMDTGNIEVEPGITGRWGITPNIIFNATLNPDFSHVEADALQLDVNLRFALRYPEKRPFFLEGADFFQTPFEAVFTRNVFDPLWGVKMTGKEGRNAFAFFAAQDRYNNLLFPSNQRSRSTFIEEDVFGGVFRYRRDIGKGSTLGVLYTGRVSKNYYNHAAGLDGFIRLSKSNSITFQFLRSQSQYPLDIAQVFEQRNEPFGGNALLAKFRHTSRNINFGFEYENLSTDFRADYGFIPRVDILKLGGFFEPILWGKKEGWFDRISLKFLGERIINQENSLTDQELGMELYYSGPLQSNIMASYYFKKEFFNGEIYDQSIFMTYLEVKPTSGLLLNVLAGVGDAVDYTNARLSNKILIRSSVDFSAGKHLNMNLANTYEQLSFEGDKIYNAHLLQARFIYNFNVRTLVRAMVQYTTIDRNVNLYLIPIEPESNILFTQFLFSYKINPQTVLFLGYSDNYLGMTGIDFTQKDRTFFLKIGYALVL